MAALMCCGFPNESGYRFWVPTRIGAPGVPFWGSHHEDVHGLCKGSAQFRVCLRKLGRSEVLPQHLHIILRDPLNPPEPPKPPKGLKLLRIA